MYKLKNLGHLRFLVAAALLIFAKAAVDAQTLVSKISFQGVLKKDNGSPVSDGEYDFKFSFWKTASGTANTDKLFKIGSSTEQWEETVTLTVNGGIYAHNLGSVTPLNPAHFSGPVFLNTRVNNKDILPRTEFTASPYAVSVAFAQKVVCSGAVGDIKYSILPPDKFKNVNGDCWVPLDGRTLNGSDALAAELGAVTLPNAGGMFLRAQDFATVSGSEAWKPKNTSDNDPDRTANTAIGSFQSYEIQSHNHNGTTATDGAHQHTNQEVGLADNDDNDGVGFYIGGRGTSFNNNGDGAWGNPGFVTNHGSAHSHAFTTSSNGGSETRPRNLNFWIYIRIN